MRTTVFARTAVVPVSAVLLAVAGLGAPLAPLQSVLVLTAVGATGLIVLALASVAYRSRSILARAPMGNAAQIARDDASAVARMESDAG